MSSAVSRTRGSTTRSAPGRSAPRGTKPARRRASGDTLGPRSRESESLDFAILREFFAEDSTRTGLDPRKSPEKVAKALGVSPATVRRRLTAWRARGFLLGFDAIPHPGLLGGRFAARVIGFQDPLAQERAIESLRLIDGMIQIEPGRAALLVVYFVDSVSQSERRLKQFRSLEGVGEIGAEMWLPFPPCTRRMSRSDWRLVLALRRNPEASVGELAKEVRQSPRTTSRRYDSLLDESALMFDPIIEFSRFHQTLAVLTASVDRSRAAEDVEREIRSIHPQSIHAAGATIPDPKGESTTVALWVSAPTSAELDELIGRVAHIRGVTGVQLWYGHSTLPIRPWLDERIEATLRAEMAAQ